MPTTTDTAKRTKKQPSCSAQILAVWSREHDASSCPNSGCAQSTFLFVSLVFVSEASDLQWKVADGFLGDGPAGSTYFPHRALVTSELGLLVVSTFSNIPDLNQVIAPDGRHSTTVKVEAYVVNLTKTRVTTFRMATLDRLVLLTIWRSRPALFTLNIR